MTDIQSEINRILQSNLSNEVNNTIKSKQKQIDSLEQILNAKNLRVNELNLKLQRQLSFINQTINKNAILEEKCSRMVTQMKLIKSEVSSFKQQCKYILQNGINSILKDFTDKFHQSMHYLSTRSRPANKTHMQISVQLKTNQQLQCQNTIANLTKVIQKISQENIKLLQQLSYLRIVEGDEQDSPKTQVLSQNQVGQFLKRTLKSGLHLVELKYCGDIVEGKKNGKGVCQYQNGFSYEGDFYENNREGYGVLRNRQLEIYRGFWQNDNFNGKGILQMYDNDVGNFMGVFKDGNMCGLGTMRYKKGYKVLGSWDKNQCIGESLLILQNGQRYLGQFIENTFRSASGSIIEL